MQFVWQHRLGLIKDAATTRGLPLRVLDPGRLNTDAGPDFFNAALKIGDQTWHGNVEMHVRASDWHRHGHDSDRAYDSVVLHVVAVDDAEIRRPDGSAIPQAVMEIGSGARERYEAFGKGSDTGLPCAEGLRSIPSIYVSDWLTALAVERVFAKSERAAAIAEATGGNWEEAAYITFARALGFGLNSEPFELTARSLPLNILLKHRDNPLSVEAMVFGQAGLIPDPAIDEDPYVEALRQEYKFMAAKFSLRSPRPQWKMARTRPQNLPYRRLALLAKKVADGFGLMGDLAAAGGSAERVRDLLSVTPEGFWATHYTFAPSRAKAFPGVLGKSAVDSLIINVAVPLLHARAASRGDDSAMERALDLLCSLPPEENSVVRLFTEAGIPCRDAFASQALVELRREFCEKKKCIYCRFGRRLLSKSIAEAPAPSATAVSPLGPALPF